MRRRILCILMALTMAVSLIPVGAGAAVFSDVPSDAWYAEDVRDIQTYGLIYGIGNNLFDPHGKLSLAQAITLAARVHALLNQTVVHENEIPWYQSYVDYADRNGICSAGEFGTNYNGECSRLTMAVLFARVFPRSTERYGNIIESLPDVEDEGYGSSVFYLYRQGVLTGNDSQGTFLPYNSISRAEAAAILNRVMDAGKRKSFTLKVKETPPPEREDIYQVVFEQYRQAKANDYYYYSNFDGLEQFSYVSYSHMDFVGPYNYVVDLPIVYTFVDIDDNGIEELLIADNSYYPLQKIIDIFTYDGRQVINPIDGTPRSYDGYPTKAIGPIIHENGILEIDYDVITNGGHDYFRMNSSGGAAILLDSVSWDFFWGTTSYFRSDQPYARTVNPQIISQEDYYSTVNQYDEAIDSRYFQWIPLF